MSDFTIRRLSPEPERRHVVSPPREYGGLTKMQWRIILAAWLLAWAGLGWYTSDAFTAAPDTRVARESGR